MLFRDNLIIRLVLLFIGKKKIYVLNSEANRFSSILFPSDIQLSSIYLQL